ncbi:hypothetical protein J14TS2_08980 [Bacillus sp. J14TS2]|nr:hypothetical protein J14TS2_08980 [Bacillus sp. J14TS2]
MADEVRQANKPETKKGEFPLNGSGLFCGASVKGSTSCRNTDRLARCVSIARQYSEA